MTKIFEPCASLSKADNEYITRLVNLNLLKIHALGVAGTAKTSPRGRPAAVDTHAYEAALARSHKVLEAVELLGRPELLAKVYLYRGHCFYNLQQWKSAHECYVRAASHRPAQELVEVRTRECLDKMGRTSSRDPPPAVLCCGMGGGCVAGASNASVDGSESDIWLQLADEESSDGHVDDCPTLSQADSVKPKLRRIQGSIASMKYSSS
ncbi:uncharacterized protein E0L32_007101 [Thyridium curvatum]|uniref:Uncharacterized protein n=1 Tax=Thyridium curvatum TaxID=1093900 RepID=A0A507AN74_9PEZI|nr:uncharacterized protein E0L32_007101 [Thyridium curvatum]TPX12215.1 hypothetical protein E0L32_007101 [Thyridium curvatum]